MPLLFLPWLWLGSPCFALSYSLNLIKNKTNKIIMNINETLKNEYKLTNDGDAWGNCMQWLFAICDYLTFETDECIPDEWQFNASPMGANEDCFCYQSLRHFAFEQFITSKDVLEFGRVLIRLRDILEHKGLSY